MNGHSTDTRPCAIIGCGLIGQSWAALILHCGHDVLLWEPDAALRSELPELVARLGSQLAKISAPAATPGRPTLASSLEEAVSGAWLIQENAPENIALKARIYEEIEEFAPDDVIVASSTSSLTWPELTEGLRFPARVTPAPPFNPPHLMPLVELYGVDEARIARADTFYRTLGRETVRLSRPATGHIANRLASALWREAVHIVAEGIADVSAVDSALRNGPGLRWSVVGAHMAYHLGGGEGGLRQYLDHLGASQERRWQSLGTPLLTPDICAALIAGVDAEARGRTIEELARMRDAGLIAVQLARRADS